MKLNEIIQIDNKYSRKYVNIFNFILLLFTVLFINYIFFGTNIIFLLISFLFFLIFGIIILIFIIAFLSKNKLN